MLALAAFVTFSTEMGMVKCLNMYPDLGWLNRMTMGRFRRMEGSGTRLRVLKAPEPSEIIWENLGIKYISRIFRMLLTSALTLALLIASFVMIYKGQVEQMNAEMKYPDTDCSAYIVTPVLPLDYDPSDLTLLTPELVREDYLWEQLNLTVGNTGKLECFCKGLLADSAYSVNGMINFKFNQTLAFHQGQDFQPWCQEWFKTYTFIRALKIGSVLVVIATNIFLRSFLAKLINIEGPKDQTTLLTSLSVKLFLASLVNTALLTVLINGNIESVTGTSDYAVGGPMASASKYGVFGGSEYRLQLCCRRRIL